MTRSARTRLMTLSLYAVFLALVVIFVLLANWEAIKDNFFLTEGFTGNWQDMVFTGAKNTILYTIISFIGGFVLAVILVLMKLAPIAPFRWLATAYIELFRGLPALVVILFMGFGVPIAAWSPPERYQCSSWLSENCGRSPRRVSGPSSSTTTDSPASAAFHAVTAPPGPLPPPVMPLSDMKISSVLPWRSHSSIFASRRPIFSSMFSTIP